MRSPSEPPGRPDESPTPLDTPALRLGRLRRLRDELVRHDLAACVLTDPVNIRYATGARNMQVFHSRNPARTLIVPAEGPVTLFEFPGCHHLAAGLETIDEIRPAITVSFAAAGPRLDEMATRWADAVDEVLRASAGVERRIGVERFSYPAAAAIAALGWRLSDAQAPVERARSIKTDEEIACIRASIAATERAVEHMQDGLRPGLTENQLWARLHKAVIEEDGDYIETRLLSAGARTNPWFREAMAQPIASGDLVALDTDVVGPYGYYADFSRTF
ncbi:MAG: aminopeptidase P family N-terminal domain-containing protein, partial [Geminicoccaceae bacterium]|nr:aminopeptidase P family N-terminal domain-containing protein [Geminicoccaceae bacterium]